MNWDQGYVVDAPYTYGYYAELAPTRADFALLLAGHAGIPDGPCCELGFGQGVSLCVNAAADRSRQWWGNDFMPEHVRFARSLADAAGLDAILCDQSFEEFCARDDLPQFAFIALHGIWSWISPRDQAVIVDFLRRKLMVGGVAYLSYNTLPGWTTMAPLRHLFNEYVRSALPPATRPVERMRAALGFVEGLLATNPAYARHNPEIGKRLAKLRTSPPEYLPHEYLNAEWHLPTFAEMSRSLADAKLAYVGPALLSDRVDVLHLTDEQRRLLDGIADPVLRETTRDVLIDQPFRRDYWVKGESRVRPGVQREALHAQSFVLSVPSSRAPTTIIGARGESSLQAAIYEPLTAFLHESGAPVSWAQIVATMGSKHGLREGQIAQAIALLVSQGALHPVQPPERAQASAEPARRLNERLAQALAQDARTSVLASAVTGTGISVPLASQLFIDAVRRGAKTPAECAQSAWKALQPQGIRLTVEGRQLETPRENLAELEKRAREYRSVDEPIYRRLGIA